MAMANWLVNSCQIDQFGVAPAPATTNQQHKRSNPTFP